MKQKHMFDPGELRHRLTLQRIVETPDGEGGIAVTWENVADAWAAFSSVATQHREIAQQIEEIATHRITIRFRSDVQSGWRFMKNDREFSINTVTDPDQSERYLVCLVEEQGR